MIRTLNIQRGKKVGKESECIIVKSDSHHLGLKGFLAAVQVIIQ